MQPHTSTLSCNLVRSSARGDPMRGCTAIERAKGEQTCKNELTADELTSERANGQMNARAKERANERKKERT